MQVLTLLGDNRYLIEQTLNQRVTDFEADDNGVAVERLDVTDMSMDQVISFLSGRSLFADRRLILLRGLSKNAELLNDLEKILNSINDLDEVVIIEPGLDRRGRLFNQLKAKTKLMQCDELDANITIKWLQDQAKTLGATIDRNSARYLLDKVGNNQLSLMQELDKLSLYSRVVDQTTIDLLVEANPQSTTFELLAATLAGDGKKVDRLYWEQRALKVDPQQIIGLLAWQLHLLACIKTAGQHSYEIVAKDNNLSAYAVKKSWPVASKISISRLKAAITRLVQLDRQSKQTNINLDDALLYYLVSF